MTPELQRYYENRFDMFSHQGWKDLIADIEEMAKATNTLVGTTPENLRFRQGELNMLHWLLSLKELSEKAYEELNSQMELINENDA